MRVHEDSHKVKACVFLYFLAALVLAWTVQASAYAPVSDPSLSPSPIAEERAAVIVQGIPGADPVALVEDQGGEVTRTLAVIDAVAARVPADQLDALRQTPGVRRVWQDAVVQAEQTGAPGTAYAPVEGAEVPDARFLLNRVVAYDGKRETLDNLGKARVDPSQYMFFTFAPVVDPSSTPAAVYLNLIVFEEGLSEAQVLVHQTSSGGWHAFDVDVSSTDGQEIAATIDLSGVLTAIEDLNKVQVRFLAATPKRGKAEVDSVSLNVTLSADVPSGDATDPTDPLPIDPSDMYEAVNALPVWSAGNTGVGIGIAVVDTGVYRGMVRKLGNTLTAE